MQPTSTSRVLLFFFALSVLTLIDLAGTQNRAGFGPAEARADLVGIDLDGDFSDWSAVASSAADPAGDGATVDLGRVWVANDQDWLFIRFETGGEIQPDEGQDVRLYLDTDLDSGTGQSFGGIGADLVWELGNRTGTFYTPSPKTVDHPDVGLRIEPTVSNTEFEIALRRDAVPAGGKALFGGNQLRFIIADNSSGDRVPDTGSIAYSFVGGIVPIPSLSLAKQNPDHVRLATWNVQSDGLFNGGSQEAAQKRMAEAMDPDIWVICEVWNHSANDVANQMEILLPSGPGETWNAVGIDGGNVVCTRLPILNSWEIFPGHRLTGVLMDLRPTYDSDILLIANHWRCCTADSERQQEADAVISFLRDARTPGGVIDLVQDTPIILGGDLNLVGLRQQLDTLLTGNIADNGTWGPDSPPDWDGSSFDVPPSRHADARMVYTWRRDTSSFYPGLLDWICYTGSVLDLGTNFILETRTMLPSTLSANGLLIDDTTTASDHAPRVADFFPATSTPAPPQVVRGGIRLLPNMPNPFNPRTTLRFELSEPATVAVAIYDARGRRVWHRPAERYEAGLQQVVWNGQDEHGRQLSSGVYRWRVRGPAGVQEASLPLVLVR